MSYSRWLNYEKFNTFSCKMHEIVSIITRRLTQTTLEFQRLTSFNKSICKQH